MRAERLAGVVAVLLGAALIAASLRLVPAALHREAARAAFDRIVAAETAQPRVATALVRHSAAALAQHGKPGDRRRLAAAAQVRGDTRRARRLLRATLRQAPADAVAWTRLAALRYWGGDKAAGAAALVRALHTAPAMRRFAAVRAELVLRLWPRLADRRETRRLALRQLQLAAEAMPQRLRKVARGIGRSALISAAVAGPRRHR